MLVTDDGEMAGLGGKGGVGITRDVLPSFGEKGGALAMPRPPRPECGASLKAALVDYTECPYSLPVTQDRFDPAKDAANQRKHALPLAFGDRIAEDGNHLIIPSIREIDGEERFKMIGIVDGKLFTGVFVWWDGMPRFISVRRSNDGAERAYRRLTPPTPRVSSDRRRLDRGQRARLIRTTRTALGLSQTEFAGRFRVPVGTLRDWKQARVSPPDFAIAYVRVIGKYPEMVAKAVG